MANMRLILATTLACALSVGFGCSVFAADDENTAGDDVESPEVELMRLQLQYECEKSLGCRAKNDEYIGKSQVDFKSYKTGVTTSLSVKGGAKFIEVDPATVSYSYER